MSRDGKSAAVRVLWPTTGPKSGVTSNTFFYAWSAAGTPGSSDYSTLCSDVWSFWNGTSGGTGTITFYLGPQIYRATNSVLIDVYSLDLLDPHHGYGSPVFTTARTPGAPAVTTPLPNEVSAVMSYRTAYGSDPEHDGITRPRASDRGRTYIGPLHTGCVNNQTAPNGTVYASLLPAIATNVLNAFSAHISAANGHSFVHSVWSRKEHLLKPTAFKAMDVSFDTTRARQVAPPSIQGWQTV